MKLARWLVESLAMNLSAMTVELCEKALAQGMNPRLVAGVRAARDVFAEHTCETDVKVLFNAIDEEIRTVLSELDAANEAKS